MHGDRFPAVSVKEDTVRRSQIWWGIFTGFSVVKEGKHIPTGEGVAIKVIDRSKYNTNDGGLEREIQVLQKVDHPCAS